MHMASLRMHSIIILVLTLQQSSILLGEGELSQVYIVYMGDSAYSTPQLVEDSHLELVTNLLQSKEAARDSILYNYKHGFSGFAAVLTKSQANHIAGFPRVVCVFPSKILSLHTTRSWDFLQVKPQAVENETFEKKCHGGKNVIIGLLDTGIWPESESFKDDKMGEIPSTWNGICQEGEHFNRSTCNKKIIGARWYIKGYKADFGGMNTSATTDYLSPRDVSGHGTHTSSTAAGGLVQRASFMGLAQGLARGGAPFACLSIYKVCWVQGCSEADILAAFDDAIHDGVNVISLSLGLRIPLPEYFRSGLSIGSFHAVVNGIPVIGCGGNEGPIAQTVVNTEPWIITVAASTIDRSFHSLVTLGNNQTFVGQSLNFNKEMNRLYHLVYGGNVASFGVDEDYAANCRKGTLNATLVRGNVILCFQTLDQNLAHEAFDSALNAGAVAIIFAQYPSKNSHRMDQDIPFVQVDYTIGTSLLTYTMRTRNPMVMISPPKTTLGQETSPKVAMFSSRGPSSLNPTVLKPDIAAPGVNILAAWSLIRPPKSEFNILSGTSMAAPHISGIVAILKEIHPTWSPAAIKSALVTTAFSVDVYGQSAIAEAFPNKHADAFDFGGGFVNFNGATDPGLVYDLQPLDYIQFLCSRGYNDTEIKLITGANTQCQTVANFLLDFNLPSIMIPELKDCMTVSRILTNVGPINSFYWAHFDAPPGISLEIEPSFLSFNSTIKKLKYKATFCSKRSVQGQYLFGKLYWSVIRPVIYGSSTNT